MVGTSQFFGWYFEGLGGIGGWVIFLGLYVLAAAWQVYDSQKRALNVPGWRLGVILPGLLLLPTVLYRFAGADTQNALLSYKELFFYVGILGGVMPVMVAVGYWITFRGLTAEQLQPRPEPEPEPQQPVLQKQTQAAQVKEEAPQPKAPPRPTVNAWLIEVQSERSYQLFKGDTRIGRSQDRNDIAIAHPTVSREHVLIREEDGYFTIYDRGATAGTLLNGRRVRAPEMLAHGDTITLGDIELKFTMP
ncbi:MAG: FHA domain-containing protein [Anaerolineae bacterium]|nr:FHA domain-containing protein [Anaerolineae bacterium]